VRHNSGRGGANNNNNDHDYDEKETEAARTERHQNEKSAGRPAQLAAAYLHGPELAAAAPRSSCVIYGRGRPIGARVPPKLTNSAGFAPAHQQMGPKRRGAGGGGPNATGERLFRSLF
jgi:hypothetical protein